MLKRTLKIFKNTGVDGTISSNCSKKLSDANVQITLASQREIPKFHPGVEISWKSTVPAEFRAAFLTMNLGEITVFYEVYLVDSTILQET